MPKHDRRDQQIDNLTKRSELLIDGLNGLISEVDSPRADQTDQQEAEIDRFLIDSLQFSTLLQFDGHFEIECDVDGTVCHANFHPPKAGGAPIAASDFQFELQKEKIVFGIIHDEIFNAINKCNNELVEVTDVLIAKGEQPAHAIRAHTELIPQFRSVPARKSGDAEQIDYRDINAFVLVKKGDVLTRYKPAQPGKQGTNIFGKFIAYKTHTIESPEPGAGVYQDGEIYKAAFDGRFRFSQNTFRVVKALELVDVDYSTGNIKFPGEVVIRGVVKDGFSIRAGGSVFCEHTLDASEVTCSGDLRVGQGIIGRRQALLKVGGAVRAKFAENCIIESDGPIFIRISMNSPLHTLGILNTGVNGMIVGGKISAREGVQATQIGTKVGIKTEIYCGLDFKTINKLSLIQAKNMDIARELREINTRINGGAKDQKLFDLRKRLSEYLKKLNQASLQLANALKRSTDAEVHVSGTIFPGCYIEICDRPYIIKKAHKHVRIYLDQNDNQIKVAAL